MAGAGDAPAAERARARAWHAGFALLLGEDVDWEAALDIADPGDRARAEWFVALGLTDVPSARVLVEKALATFREVGDTWGVAAALSRLARDAFTVRDLEALERDGGESARLFRELGDGWGRLQATEWLAGLCEIRGEYERAARLFAEDLRTAEELGLWPETVRRLSWLGWIAMNTGDYASAMEHCGRALRLADGQGYREGRIFAQMGYGYAARRGGRLEEAERHIGRLLDGVPRDGEPPLFLPTALVELGFVHESRGDAEGARALFLGAFAAARRIGDPRTTALTVEGLAAASPPGECARLLGLAAAARLAHGTPASQSEEAEARRIADRARDALGEEAYAAAHAHGRELTFDDVA